MWARQPPGRRSSRRCTYRSRRNRETACTTCSPCRAAAAGRQGSRLASLCTWGQWFSAPLETQSNINNAGMKHKGEYKRRSRWWRSTCRSWSCPAGTQRTAASIRRWKHTPANRSNLRCRTQQATKRPTPRSRCSESGAKRSGNSSLFLKDHKYKVHVQHSYQFWFCLNFVHFS